MEFVTDVGSVNRFITNDQFDDFRNIGKFVITKIVEGCKETRVEEDEIAALALMAAAKIMEKDLSKSGEQEKIVDQIIEEVGKSGWQN